MGFTHEVLNRFLFELSLLFVERNFFWKFLDQSDRKKA